MVIWQKSDLPAQNAHADRRLQVERVGTTVRSHRLATANESIRFCTVTAMKYGLGVAVVWMGETA